MARRSPLALLGIVLWLGLSLARPASTGAASGLWTATGLPLVLSYGTPSTIDVTITGGTTAIGCVEVMLTSRDAADGATITVQPLLATWTAKIVPGSKDDIVLTAASDADRLTLAKVLVVAITVTTSATGTESWEVRAHPHESTSGGSPGSTTITPIVVIGAGPTATPTATPTSTPTPSPSPTRTATPSPSARPSPTGGQSPSPGPSARASPSPSPSAVAAGPTPSPAPSDGRTAGAGGTGSGGGGAGSGTSTGTSSSGSGSAGSGGSGSGLTVPDDPRGSTGGAGSGDSTLVGLGSASLDASFHWLIPTFALTVPGLLIIGVVAIQLLTGLTFIQLTRRWLGALFERRKRGAGTAG